MSSNTVNFTINLNGNAYDGMINLDRAIGDVIGSSREAMSSLNKIGKMAFSFDSISNVIGKVSQAFQSVVGSSLDFEKQTANIRTLLNGNEEATSALIGQIKDYSKATTYSTGELVEAQKTMMAFGLDADFAFGKLKNIGDIALGDKQHMQQLALAFSQMSSTGKLTAQDLNQMINAGFNPLEVISQKTGKSIGKLKDAMGKGKISVDMVSQAFEWATEEGGRFYNGAEAAANTTSGKIDQVNKSIDDFKIKLFEATGGATAWAASLSEMLVPVSQMAPLVGAVGKGVLSMVKLSGRALVGWFKSIPTVTMFAVKQIKLLGGAIGRGVGSIRGYMVYLQLSVKRAGGPFSFMKLKWNGFVTSIKTGVKTVVARMARMKASITSTGRFFPWLAGMAKAACRGIGSAIASIPVLGWVAIALSAIVSLSAFLYKKCEGVRKWFDGIGSAILLIGGPLGIVINMVTSLIKHWESVKKAFTDGGIIAGLKRICFVVFDGLIKPIQSLLKAISKIPGLEGVAEWAEDIQALRDRFDNATQVNSVLDPEEEEEEEEEVVVDPLKGGDLGSDSGTSAGKAQQITIKLENMVGTMNFNGGLRENARDVESILMEQMARILGMASTAM